MRLVIADDNQSLRLMLRVSLPEYADIEVVGEASNGREAVELTRQLKPDVLLLDLAMPVMDGLEAAEEIRQFDSDVYIIVLSGFEASVMGQQASRAGANQYLEKGVDIERLAHTVALGFHGRLNGRPKGHPRNMHVWR